MAVLVAYRSSNGRLLWWAIDADPKAFKARPGETIVEMPADEYGKIHPQAFVFRETGLDPGDDDKFVELDERGAVKRVFYDEPTRQLGARERKYRDVKAEPGRPVPGGATV